ncbi:HNH endonuclease [Rhodococcus sp. SJ-2]
MAVSKRLRYEILRRDNHACRYCGATAPEVKLTVDHVTPIALGGSDEPSNLVTACVDCNSGKSSSSADSPIVEDVDYKAALWGHARELVARRMLVDLDERSRMEEHFFDEWEAARPNAWRSSDLPVDFVNSIEQFVRSGLPYEVLLDLVHVSMDNRVVSEKWRYFCGCAWTRIRQLNEDAAALISRWEADSAT